MMNKYVLAGLFAALLLTVGVEKSWAGPCDSDVDRYCADVQPGQGSLGDCFTRNLPNFSLECREWAKKMDSALRRLGACTSDAREFCRDVRPGYGRVVSCLKSNADKLSTPCQDALNNR